VIDGLRPYPAYRDSGVEWLGGVPEGWEVRRLKYTSEPLVNGVWGGDPDGVNDIACVRVADFDRERLVVKKSVPTMRAVNSMERDRRLLKRGDLLLEKSGGGEQQPVGVVVEYTSNVPAISSNFVARMRPRSGFIGRYLTYLHCALYSKRINVRSVKQTTGIQNLDGDRYLVERVPLATISEQGLITRFLDHVDSRIQQFIATKERLVKLLEEEKRAIIHSATTRGLDPDVVFKPSGINWLDDVPEHWDLSRLKNIAWLKAGEAITAGSINENGEIPVYGGNGLRGYTSGFTHEGDRILIGRQGALCGNVHLVGGRFWASEHAIVLEAGNQCDIRWISLLLTAMNLNQYSEAAAQPGLSTDRIKNLGIPVPPLAEQRRIVEVVDKTTAGVDGAGELASRHISLLREYRTRLISDVVTGKLDVREVAEQLPDDPDTDDPALDERLEEAAAA